MARLKNKKTGEWEDVLLSPREIVEKMAGALAKKSCYDDGYVDLIKYIAMRWYKLELSSDEAEGVFQFLQRISRPGSQPAGYHSITVSFQGSSNPVRDRAIVHF